MLSRLKFLIVALLFVTSAQAGLFPEQPTLTIAGRKFTDLTNLKILYSYFNCSSFFGTPRLFGTGVGYTPSGSNKFHIYAIELMHNTANWQMEIGYSNTDVGILSASAGTSPITSLGGSFGSNPMYFAITSVQSLQLPVNIIIPNGKYVQTWLNCSGGAGSMRIFGYEEP